jgi:ABC-type glycerol-3-phosphate transport system permease component
MNSGAPDSPVQVPRGWQRVTRYSLLVAVAVLFVLPLFWMVSSSLKPEYQMFASPQVWWPSPPRWQNYSEALTQQPFDQYAVNTLLIAIGSIAGSLLSCTLVAYGFARLRARGRGPLFLILLATLMLPYPVTMVPLFIMFSRIGWVNTFWPLIVPAFFGNAFYIFLLRQFFLQIPGELEDAARLDGASELQILRHVVVPLSKPALATVAVFAFQASWNDFLGPLIFLQDQSRYTLMLGLSFFRGGAQINWAYLMATALVIVVPIVVLYFIAQRAFTEGVSFSELKI